MTANRRKGGKSSQAENGPESDLQRSGTKRTGTILDFIGMLAGKTEKVATLEEIKRATEDGWAGLCDEDMGRRARRKTRSTKKKIAITARSENFHRN